jgi:hypothetical protein
MHSVAKFFVGTDENDYSEGLILEADGFTVKWPGEVVFYTDHVQYSEERGYTETRTTNYLRNVARVTELIEAEIE